MITLPHLSAISLIGPDAEDFLHNQLSADVKGLASHETTFACYCEPKGRVLALLLVARSDHGFNIVLSSSLAKTVADRMKVYVMRSKVDIAFLSDTGVTGFQQREQCDISTVTKPVIPLPGGKRWLSLTKSDSTPDINQGMLERWQYSELQQGICWLGDLTSGQFLPQMLGFDTLGAVNFKKGCYPGQEIVARTHYLGKVKRHPRTIEMSKVPHLQPMDKIHLQTNAMTDEAVLVGSAGNEELGYCLFVVTRLEPEVKIEQIEFKNT